MNLRIVNGEARSFSLYEKIHDSETSELNNHVSTNSLLEHWCAIVYE